MINIVCSTYQAICFIRTVHYIPAVSVNIDTVTIFTLNAQQFRRIMNEWMTKEWIYHLLSVLFNIYLQNSKHLETKKYLITYPNITRHIYRYNNFARNLSKLKLPFGLYSPVISICTTRYRLGRPPIPKRRMFAQLRLIDVEHPAKFPCGHPSYMLPCTNCTRRCSNFGD